MTEPRGGNFRDLLVWQKSITLVKESYRIARELPTYEVYGLASQLRRASVSIPSNIAEGNRRIHRKEYIHHLSIARGSVAELETHIEIARMLSYIPASEVGAVQELIDHVSRMLTRLIASLEN